VRPFTHGALGDGEHLRHLAIAPAALEHQGEHGTLVGWQSVELGHVFVPVVLVDAERSP
jgi:hypothetical protein